MNHPKILMAPLEGVNDRSFRLCYYRHFKGLSAALTPFLPIPDRTAKVPLRILETLNPPGSVPVSEIPQILVSRSAPILKAAAVLEDAGYTELNWNMGCPSKGVVNKGKGAGLMPDRDKILSILDEILPRLSLSLSIKLRMGLEEAGELYRLLPDLKDYPLARLILHPRLGTQMYRGEVDLSGFREALRLYGKPICYNGDINSVDDYDRLRRLFPEVEEWMLGRGLMADPFLPEKITESASGNREEMTGILQERFRLFLDDLWDTLEKDFPREESLTGYMKGILFYSFKTLPGEYLQKLRAMKNRADWKRLEKELFCRGISTQE